MKPLISAHFNAMLNVKPCNDFRHVSFGSLCLVRQCTNHLCAAKREICVHLLHRCILGEQQKRSDSKQNQRDVLNSVLLQINTTQAPNNNVSLKEVLDSSKVQVE